MGLAKRYSLALRRLGSAETHFAEMTRVKRHDGSGQRQKQATDHQGVSPAGIMGSETSAERSVIFDLQPKIIRGMRH
jgi:hypothetical protein